MAQLLSHDRPLPQFRKDLELFQGPENFDGSPTYNLFDPLSGRYFKIGWKESLVIQYLEPDMKLHELLETVEEHTGYHLTEGEVQDFFEDAYGKKLLILHADADELSQAVENKKINPIAWLLRNHLFIRIPIFHPEKFLNATLPFVRPLASPFAFWIYLLVGAIGLLMMIGRFDEYVGSFVRYFNLQGIVYYLLTLFVVRMIHELAHAYTAKNYGVPVPSLGIVFIVFLPTVYTDVTHSWKLWDRSKRLRISAAGIAAELVIAGLSTMLWSMCEPGILKNIFFLTSSVTLLSSLVVNLNIAVKYDGYFILCDLWGVDNLQMEAFSATRWFIWKKIFGIETPPHNQLLVDQHLKGLLLYSLYSWLYRLSIYSAIVYIVYTWFTKALGIVILAAELWSLVIYPLVREVVAIWTQRRAMHFNLITAIALLIGGTGIVWLVFPWPHPVTIPAVAVARVEQSLYAPYSAQIKTLYVENGQSVSQGAPLLSLRSIPLDYLIQLSDVKIQQVEEQIARGYFEEEYQQFIASKQSELAAAEDEWKRYQLERQSLTLTARISGVIDGWDQGLREGQYIHYNTFIGRVVDVNQLKILCYVPEYFIDQISVGEEVTFTTTRHDRQFVGKVSVVQTMRAERLEHMELAIPFGGPLAVINARGEGERGNKLVESLYIVELDAENHDLSSLLGQTGSVQFTGHWHSKLWVMLRYAMNILWRESGV